jgi:hypothetical protein
MLRSLVRFVGTFILGGIIAATLVYFFPDVFQPPPLN